jgi:hypothetical protein
MFTETKMKNELALALTGYGHYHKKTGEVAKTREYFIKALDIFERVGTMIEPDKVKNALSRFDFGT